MKIPYSIIRPSHTYDKTKIQAIRGYTVLHRMLEGMSVILPGNGTSIWTLTWNKDFAVRLVNVTDQSKDTNIGDISSIVRKIASY